jgi:hypothetical protein
MLKYQPWCDKELFKTPFPGIFGHEFKLACLTEFLTRENDWAEFGVWKGESVNALLPQLPQNSMFHLFDSFKGLPEQWTAWSPPGHFGLEETEIPNFQDERCKLWKGWFADTLPVWKKQQTRPLNFIHIDCDLYSSTKTVLTECNDFIIPGTLMIFDELYGYPNWRDHEHKAFQEWVHDYSRAYTYLRRAKIQVCLRINK